MWFLALPAAVTTVAATVTDTATAIVTASTTAIVTAGVTSSGTAVGLGGFAQYLYFATLQNYKTLCCAKLSNFDTVCRLMAIVLRHSLPFNGNSTLLCFSYLGETQLVLCLCKIKTTVQNHLGECH